MTHTSATASAQVRSSRIQVEVREIPVVKQQATLSRHDVDSDGGDISNE
ncbi:hypothetical protein HJG54_28210 [Leptolyngbya sp. NK1-12]|uniref:Uncharacterized protein n=1 Tax=Leptolyngbya sp. NK1-12 TaxID=2547451 RepID=A0AA96WJK0_9CYAN|nr:hypothetical protein [Leptolyngbya sp. NK1-12]WNZ26320.1 hypothetical protein HJG54_28210 [Leptolyngbya sp. NK1-12]